MTASPCTPKAAHRALLDRPGTLLVLRTPVRGMMPAAGQPGAASDYVPTTPDIFIAMGDDGSVQAFNGHVDLGTGIRTALAQIVAEELYVQLDRVTMTLGHTEAAPNQGPTIASATIQIAAVPLRRAAAQAREWLLDAAAQQLHVPRETLRIRDGVVFAAPTHAAIDPSRSHNGTLTVAPARATDAAARNAAIAGVSYADLLIGQRIALTLADDVPLKPVSAYRIVGSAPPRVDIPAKATGVLTFVHDVRVPGMLHGRVVRPPYTGRDCGAFVGTSLIDVDRTAALRLPGVRHIVVEGDFIGVVAEREEQAIAAARRIKARWRPIPPGPDLSSIETALLHASSTARPLTAHGDVDTALAHAAQPLSRTYVWPYQMHASIGPSCAVADYTPDGLTIWSGTQNPHMLRIDLDRLLGMGEDRIEIVRLEASGCYGRNCADDVAADAALLSRAAGAPVRVQLSREQEHAWEPKGAAQLMTVRGALDTDGGLGAYDFTTRYPSNDAPLLASLLTGKIAATPRVLEMGDRTAVSPYRFKHLRAVCHDMPALVRAAWLRGVSALPNSFAHDSFVDELAHDAGADPVDFRLRHLDDTRAADLLRAVATRAAWQAGQHGTRGKPAADGLLRGRGVAYARYVHSRFPGFGAAWSAWVVDLTVDPTTGRIVIDRVTIGQDTGMMVNPDGVRHQMHGNVIQVLSRVLKERVAFDADGVASLEWGGYPILSFDEVPEIDVLLMPRQDEPPLGAGESASVPGPAAVANALFDATGVRFRAPPFTPDTVRAMLSSR